MSDRHVRDLKKFGNVLVAFRTHFWNETVDSLAKKLYGSVVEADFCVIADETRQVLDCTPFEKIVHTADMSHLGLPHWPQQYNNLHYNGDYVLYELQRQKPKYDFYFLIENDTVANIDFDVLFDRIFKEKIDVVCQIDEINSAQHKPYHLPAKVWFENTGRAFFPFVGVSRNFVTNLYQKRIDIQKDVNDPNGWLYCELYVASFLLSDPAYKYINIKDIYNTEKYTFMKHKYLYDANVLKRNAICHPVTGKEFVEKNLIVTDINSIFDARSDLFNGLKALSSTGDISFYPVIEQKIKEKRSIDTLVRFRDMAFSEGWIDHIPDVNRAFAKKAIQSSVCDASTFQDVSKDAELVIDGYIIPQTKSHTSSEMCPWIEIDLDRIFEIRLVLIYVRPEYFHIFNNFYITFSQSHEDPQIVYRKSDGVVPDSADLKPICIRFPQGKFARFVRITLDDHGPLFLNQVEVYSY